jgi:hypothetical protein
MDFTAALAKLSPDQKREFWCFVNDRQEMLREGMCFNPGGGCSGAACNAHSIQQSKLSLIARAGHVFGFDFDLGTMAKRDFFTALAKQGIEEVSVFRGFCREHDADLFRLIDTGNFNCTPEQLFLYFYRSLCREVHVRHCCAKAAVTAEDVARLNPEVAKNSYENEVGAIGVHFVTEALRLYFVKLRADGIWLNREFRRLKHFVITFSSLPTVLSAAVAIPTCGFDGKGFSYVIHPTVPYPIMTVTTVPTFSGGALILSWFDNASAEIDRFCESFNAVSSVRLTSSVIRFLFEFCDNIAIAPAWWDSLSDDHRKTLLGHARGGTPPIRRSDSCLVDDGRCYGDWSLARRFRL